MSRTWSFDIEHHGERDTGILPFSDNICVTVDSGDPGGEEGEFANFLCEVLTEWYDGAKVIISTKEESPDGK